MDKCVDTKEVAIGGEREEEQPSKSEQAEGNTGADDKSEVLSEAKPEDDAAGEGEEEVLFLDRDALELIFRYALANESTKRSAGTLLKRVFALRDTFARDAIVRVVKRFPEVRFGGGIITLIVDKETAIVTVPQFVWMMRWDMLRFDKFDIGSYDNAGCAALLKVADHFQLCELKYSTVETWSRRTVTRDEDFVPHVTHLVDQYPPSLDLALALIKNNVDTLKETKQHLSPLSVLPAGHFLLNHVMPAKRSKDRAPIDNGEKYVVLRDDDGEPVLRIWSGFLKPESRPTTTTSVCEDVVTAEEKTTISAEEKTVTEEEKPTVTEEEKLTTTISPEEKATPTIRGTVNSSYLDPKTQLQSVQSTLAAPQSTVTRANPKGYWSFHPLRKSDVPVNVPAAVFVPPFDRGEVFPLRFTNNTRHYIYVRTTVDSEERVVLLPRAIYRTRNMPATRVRDPNGTITKLVNRVLDPVTADVERNGPKYFLVPPGGNDVQAIYVKKTNKFKQPPAGTDSVFVDIVTSLADISLLHKEKGRDWPFTVGFAKYPAKVVRHHVKLFYARTSNEAFEGDPTGKYVALGADEENTKDGQDAKPKDKKK